MVRQSTLISNEDLDSRGRIYVDWLTKTALSHGGIIEPSRSLARDKQVIIL